MGEVSNPKPSTWTVHHLGRSTLCYVVLSGHSPLGHITPSPGIFFAIASWLQMHYIFIWDLTCISYSILGIVMWWGEVPFYALRMNCMHLSTVISRAVGIHSHRQWFHFRSKSGPPQSGASAHEQSPARCEHTDISSKAAPTPQPISYPTAFQAAGLCQLEPRNHLLWRQKITKGYMVAHCRPFKPRTAPKSTRLLPWDYQEKIKGQLDI